MSHLLIEAGPVETRAARIEADTVQALWVGPAFTDTLPPVAGERLSAVIRTIDKRLGAAFVLLGADAEGFLPLPSKLTLSEGAGVVVAVRREALPGKLAQVRLSADQCPPGADRPSVLVHAVSAIGGQHPEKITVAGSVEAFLAIKNHYTEIETAHAGSALFADTGAEEVFEQALAHTVILPDGVRLTFDEAEALTAVDVDVSAMAGQSKKGAAQRACLSAVPHIIRHIALRRLGGQVVIDFPLARREGDAVEQALKQAVSAIAQAQLHRLSSAGLVALTLPRTGPSLLQQVSEPVVDAPIPGRRYTGRHLAACALRAAERALDRPGGGQVTLHAGPAIAGILEDNPDWTEALCARYGNRLTLSPDADKKRDWYDVAH